MKHANVANQVDAWTTQNVEKVNKKIIKNNDDTTWEWWMAKLKNITSLFCASTELYNSIEGTSLPQLIVDGSSARRKVPMVKFLTHIYVL